MSEQKKQQRLPVYDVCRAAVAFLFKTLFPVKYIGREKLPAQRPYIAIGNHVTMVDPVLVAVAIKKDYVRFVGKKELAKTGILRWFFGKLRVIFIDRHNSDMEAMRTCLKVLRDGEVLGIFPEGTRHHEGLMTELESGTALIALRSGAPLVPFYIPGKIGLFRRLTVTIGDPIPTEDLRAQGLNTETCRLLMDRITAVYAEMAAK